MTDTEMELFWLPDCPHCRSAKDYLSRKGVNWRECDVSRDEDAMRRMLSLTGRAAVPTIRVGNAVLVGFDAAKLDEMIERLRRADGPK